MNKVEAVAKASWEAQFSDPWITVDDQTRQLALDGARAAIETMKGPTKVMMQAKHRSVIGMQWIDNDPQALSDAVDTREFDAMLQAALDEAEE